MMLSPLPSNLNGMQGITITQIDGVSYIFVIAASDNMTMFKVEGSGSNIGLSELVTINDNSPLRLNSPQKTITTVINGIAYLFVVGYDDRGGQYLSDNPFHNKSINSTLVFLFLVFP